MKLFNRPADTAAVDAAATLPEPRPGATPIGATQWRQRTRVSGRVRSVRVQPWSGVATLECTLRDNTGGLVLVFLGRREVAGIRPGVHLSAEGMIGEHDGRLAILNPDYEFDLVDQPT
jgi:hypothetical protein